MFRSWAAELAPFPNRWRRAARVAFVTSLGAGIMATLQIANPLGLTLLVSLAAPEFAFNLAPGVVFLLTAATFQVLALFVVGALVDSPVLLVSAFIVFTAISTYLIYESEDSDDCGFGFRFHRSQPSTWSRSTVARLDGTTRRCTQEP